MTASRRTVLGLLFAGLVSLVLLPLARPALAAIRNAGGSGVFNPAAGSGSGTMNLNHVTVSGNGTSPDSTLRGSAGLDNRATMTLTDVTVTGNTGGINQTGGIFNAGTLTATNLT